MRDETDLVPVSVLIESRIFLDLEQLEQDPVWYRVSSPYNLADPDLHAAALEAYVREYLIREDNKILRFMPSHCGPGDVLAYKVEVYRGRSSSGSGSAGGAQDCDSPVAAPDAG
jgi:hypothetical protein